MKFPISRLSFCSLLSLAANAFPSLPSNGLPKLSHDLRDLARQQAEKRLLFDPLTKPIQGKFASIYKEISSFPDRKQLREHIPSFPLISRLVTSVVPVQL